MSERDKYYVYIGKEAIEVSKEVYEVYYKGERKERYFSVDLKTERNKVDKESGTKVVIPSREDSYERLVKNEKQFASENESVEDMAIKTMLLNQLNEILKTLSYEERRLIYELFYIQRTERELCAMIGIGKTTLHKRKEKLLAKLRKILENK